MERNSLVRQHVTGLESLSRWCALIGGLDLINEGIELRGLDGDDVRLDTRVLETFVEERAGDVLQGFKELAEVRGISEDTLFEILIRNQTFDDVDDILKKSNETH